jgi:hypothetical protein
MTSHSVQRGTCGASAVVFALLLAGCARDAPAPLAWEGRVDTLPSGTIVMSNPARGLWDSAATWRLVEDLRIGSAEGDRADAFGRIGDLAADRSGRIYVLDRQAQEVRAFAPTGAYLGTLGRKGGGPGEFLGADRIAVDDSARLWVSDPRSRRYTAFDSTGLLVGDYPRRASNNLPQFRGGTAAGDLWEEWPAPGPDGTGRRTKLLEFAHGTYRDSLVFPPFGAPTWEIVHRVGTSTMIFQIGVPYTARELLAVEPVGAIWRAVSSEYRLTRFSRAGDSVRVVSRAYDPVPVTTTERERAVARYRRDFPTGGRVIDESAIPKEKPALRLFFADDRGFVWVVPYTADDSATVTFDLFDPVGRYLGAVVSPLRPSELSPTPVVGGTSLYYVTRDELDVEYVVRMQIEGRD